METRKEETIPGWLKLKSSEVEALVLHLAKKDLSPAKLGLELRDNHGIPKIKTVTNKRLSVILKSTNTPFKSESSHIEQKIEKLNSHIKANKLDYTANRALTKKLWALKKIS